MDRRQQRTHEAIHGAFSDLLSERDYATITVSDIIRRAGVGRTTFYEHFDSKEALLDDVCEGIFAHVFATPQAGEPEHDFSQGPTDLHAFMAHFLCHVRENDHGIADLLRGRSSDVVMAHLQRMMYDLVSRQIVQGDGKGAMADLPRSLVAHHVAVSLIGAIHWWVMHDMAIEPDQMADYFVRVMAPLEQ